MKFYYEDSYKSFENLMKSVYGAVYSKEKEGFTVNDAMVLGTFSIALDTLYAVLMKSIEKDYEEDE